MSLESDSHSLNPAPVLDPEFSAKYVVGKRLGRGAFSTVHEATKKSTRSVHAVKIIRKEEVQKDSRSRTRIDNEMLILGTVSHNHIIPLHEIIEGDHHIYFVMELVTGGELFDRIVAKGFYSEREACLVVKNVMSAIEYLHEKNIAHRDLKPENLLLKDADDTHVMISDFGLSRVLGDTPAFTACGTPYYVAPEVVSGQGYGKEVDLWSIGVITYFLLAGFPPFMGETLPEIVEQIMNGDYEYPSPYWDNVSEKAKDFVSNLLVTDKNVRMTATQALSHPWIRDSASAPTNPLQNQDLRTKASKLKRMQ